MKKLLLAALLSVVAAIHISAQKSDASVSKLFQNYLDIKNSLVADRSDGASRAAADLLKSAAQINAKTLAQNELQTIKQNASKISTATSIKIQRESFNNLSENMMLLARKFKLADQTVFIQYCPMAKASWLSAEKKIQNPYYGSSMLTCGTVKNEHK
ncbi:DUF3347 domain-containing protein [Kaistella palustris]|uniref:DUF3347 domain-containing protein n=1 Tax=Kaistella palustris TaxID=493376 RepID=UPI0004829DFF|nr:DUF3347 domain-containing protein [Kaistella palustris]